MQTTHHDADHRHTGPAMRVLVAGATGYLGGFVARELKARGHLVRALARSAAKLEPLGDSIDEAVEAEVTRPETLAQICDGIDVVITGTSTGIGRATALHLDRLGCRVLAGVRREIDGQALKGEASDRLTPILLDVTDDASIADAVRKVEQSTSGRLHGLVNNAGISLNGPLELIPLEEVRKLMDVNVIGLLAVTKAFLPLLRAARGRIVNISSGHGLLAIPDKSAYAASKFAVQAISDALRVELSPFGVTVSCLAVGKVETEVLGKIVAERERMVRDASPQLVELYQPLIDYFDAEVKHLPGVSPETVANVVARALTDARPKAHYLVGPGARKMKNLARLPVALRDGLMYRAIYRRRSP